MLRNRSGWGYKPFLHSPVWSQEHSVLNNCESCLELPGLFAESPSQPNWAIRPGESRCHDSERIKVKIEVFGLESKQHTDTVPHLATTVPIVKWWRLGGRHKHGRIKHFITERTRTDSQYFSVTTIQSTQPRPSGFWTRLTVDEQPVNTNPDGIKVKVWRISERQTLA